MRVRKKGVTRIRKTAKHRGGKGGLLSDGFSMFVSLWGVVQQRRRWRWWEQDKEEMDTTTSG
jgi:hypothetical protein